MSLAVLADHLASKGRNGDTMLVHMTPEEVHGLHALALAHGGKLTINPETGLPEASFLKSLLPMIAGFALAPLTAGTSLAFLGATPLASALTVGAVTGLATGSLQKGIMAGLGAYGGASLGAGLTQAGMAGIQSAAGEAAAKTAADQLALTGTLGQEEAAKYVQQQVAAKAAATTPFEAMKAGLSGLGSEAGRQNLMAAFGSATGAGGLSGLARAGMMAAAPIIADQAVQTATPMPGGQRYQGTIRPYKFDPYSRTWTAQPTYPAVPVNTAAEPAPQPPGGYNTGGIVALADGGTAPGMTGSIAEQNVLNTKNWQSRSGLTGIEGLNSNINMWFQDFPKAGESDIRNAMQQYGLSDADIVRATGKTVGDLAYKPPMAQTTATTTPIAGAGGAGPLPNPFAAQIAAGEKAIPYATGARASDDELRQIYRDLLGREADQGGFEFYKASQFSPEQIRQEIMKSVEYKNRPLNPVPVVGDTTIPGYTGADTTYGGATTPEYTAPQPQVTLGPAFQPTPQTMEQVRTDYEQGGGATRMPTITDIKPGERTYTLNAVADMITKFLQQNPNAQYSEVQQFAKTQGIPEMQARAAYNEFRFSTMTGGTKAAYDYLMGRTPYSAKPFVPGGGPIAVPYAEAMGLTGGSRFRTTMPPRGDGATPDKAAQGSTSTTGSTTSTTGAKTTTPSVDTLRTSFDQSIFSKTPEEKAAYYNSLLGQGYTDEQIRAAINAPLDDNWLALRDIAARLRAGTTGTTGGTTRTTGGGTTTTGGGITLLGGSNTAASNTGTGVDTTRSTDASTVGGVVVGNNVIDPISGGVLGVVTANVDQGTGGIIQGDVVVDPITGKIIGYSQDAGLIARLVNKNIGEEPAPIESRYVPSDTAYYDFGQGDIGGYGGSYTKDEMDMMAGMRRGGLADVAAAAAARGGNVQQYNLGGYSDGGRLLRGPGDGVSDSIPATIGGKQPARLADGEFVVPARIVSEIGNGSTEAGARKLYAMMDRVQRARAKTTGKGKVAKNTRAEKYLPA